MMVTDGFNGVLRDGMSRMSIFYFLSAFMCGRNDVVYNAGVWTCLTAPLFKYFNT